MQVDELRLLKAGLEEMPGEFKRQLFGTKSEKTKAVSASAGDEPKNPPAETTVKEHTRTKKKKATRDERYAGIPVRDVIIPVPDKDRLCPYCNAEMALPGHKEVRTELRITLAKVERIRYMQEELICPECRKDGDDFQPIYTLMHGHLLQRDVIHADGTTCQVLREKGKAAESTSYMWMYLSGSDGLPPIVPYEYQAGAAAISQRLSWRAFPASCNATGTADITKWRMWSLPYAPRTAAGSFTKPSRQNGRKS